MMFVNVIFIGVRVFVCKPFKTMLFLNCRAILARKVKLDYPGKTELR